MGTRGGTPGVDDDAREDGRARFAAAEGGRAAGRERRLPGEAEPRGGGRNADIERARAATVGPRASDDPRASTGVTSPLIYRPRARRGARDSARGQSQRAAEPGFERLEKHVR